MLQALPRLSRAVVRVRRIGAQVNAMALNHQSSGSAQCQDQAGSVTAAILIIGDEILKVRTAVLLISYLVVQVIRCPFIDINKLSIIQTL